MIRAKRLLLDPQGAPVERFGLTVETLIAVESSQVVETGCCRGMIRTMGPLTNCQGSFKQWFGLAVKALIL